MIIIIYRFFFISLAAHVFSNQFLEEVGQIKGHSGHRATLLFTGASAAWKGSEGFAGFSAAKAGLRMMIESLAREKGKELVHVCHIVIDGLLDTSAVSSQLGEAPYQNSVSVKVDRGAQRSLLTFTSLAYQCKRSG
jgi:NAD(P)-dependent dehydrogenase (short-subunit alcohol dehydrogenase family)